MENWSDGENRARMGCSQSSEYSNTPSLRCLFVLWRSRRDDGVFLSDGGGADALPFPVSAVQMIPHHLDFQPGIVLVPLSAVFFGPAGVWGALAASLLGDKLFGQWNVLSWYRAAAVFFFALGTMRLWISRPGARAGVGTQPLVGACPAVHVCLVVRMLPGGIVEGDRVRAGESLSVRVHSEPARPQQPDLLHASGKRALSVDGGILGAPIRRVA